MRLVPQIPPPPRPEQATDIPPEDFQGRRLNALSKRVAIVELAIRSGTIKDYQIYERNFRTIRILQRIRACFGYMTMLKNAMPIMIFLFLFILLIALAYFVSNGGPNPSYLEYQSGVGATEPTSLIFQWASGLNGKHIALLLAIAMTLALVSFLATRLLIHRIQIVISDIEPHSHRAFEFAQAVAYLRAALRTHKQYLTNPTLESPRFEINKEFETHIDALLQSTEVRHAERSVAVFRENHWVLDYEKAYVAKIKEMEKKIHVQAGVGDGDSDGGGGGE